MLLSFESWRCRSSRRGKRVLERELFQHLLRRALLAAGRLLQRGQFQLVEQHLAKLRPRVDVECPAGQGERFGLDRRDPVGELARQLLEPLDVDLHARRLHPRQHGDERPLELGVQLPQALFFHLGRQDRLDPPGRVGVLAGILGHPVDRDLVHPPLRLSLADQIGDRNHRVIEQALRKLIEVVVALAALEQVTQDHRVGDRPIEFDAGALEREHVVLDILADLFDVRVAQYGPESREGRRRVEHARSGRPAHRQVIRLAGLPAKREPDEIGPQGVDRGGLGIDAKSRLLFQFAPESRRIARAYRRRGRSPPRSTLP